MKQSFFLFFLAFIFFAAKADNSSDSKKNQPLVTPSEDFNLSGEYSFAPPENFTVDAKTSVATWDAPSDSTAMPQQYQINLGNTTVATVPADQFSYQFECLQYGQNYSASVYAIYSNGISAPATYTWTSTYLRPVEDPFAIYDFGHDYVNFLLWPVAPCDSTTPTDWGLLSFDIFRDGDSLYNVPYDQSGTVYFQDGPLYPGQYIYCARTVWDLTSFGLPGQTDVSMKICDTVHVAYGYFIPFTEDWSMGTFEYHQWTPEGNWVISNNVGNDPPSAFFEGTGNSPYFETLTSYYFNADTNSLGVFHLHYEIKLQNLTPTGTEKLTIEVNDGSGWHSLKTYTNSVSYDWTTDSVDLTPYALGNVFSIRFVASGENSGNIAGWYLDNISIDKYYDYPVNSGGESDEINFCSHIFWQKPVSAVSDWKSFDSGTSQSGAVLPDSNTFSLLNRFVTDDYYISCAYDNIHINKIKFLLTDSSFQYVIAKIWKNNYPDPPIAVWADTITGFNINQWTEVSVDTVINGADYVGYTIVGNQQGHYPVGVDTTGYNGLDYVMFSDGNMIPLGNYSEHKLKIRTYLEGDNYTEGNDCDYFLIYQYNWNSLEYEFIDSVPAVPGQIEYDYCNYSPHMGDDYYRVKAHWTNNMQSGLSSPGKDCIYPYNDFITVIWERVDEHHGNESLDLYPNPATDEVTLEAENQIKEITVFNNLGQTVYNRNISKKKTFKFSTSAFKPGIYFVKVITERGKFIKKLIIKQ